MAVNTIGNGGTPQPLPAAAPPKGRSAPAAAAPAAAAPAAAAKAPQVVSAPAPQQPSPEQVQKAVDTLKQMIQASAAAKLDFSVDEATGKTIVRVNDPETGEMIRQIPAQELLDIARSLDKLQGLMLKDQA